MGKVTSALRPQRLLGTAPTVIADRMGCDETLIQRIPFPYPKMKFRFASGFVRITI